MKYKIWEGRTKAKKGTVLLKLQYDGNDVCLVAVNGSGSRLNHGYICYIDKYSNFKLPNCINPKLGLKLNKQGRVIVVRD